MSLYPRAKIQKPTSVQTLDDNTLFDKVSSNVFAEPNMFGRVVESSFFAKGNSTLIVAKDGHG